MRVLVSSTSGVGHLFPLVPLARALRDAGHDVLWVTGADSVGYAEAAGIPARAGGPSDAQRAAATRDVLGAASALPGHERAAFMFPGLFAGILAPAMVDDLLSVAREWRPDLLVHEQAELAAPLVAALVGVPSVTHAFGGAVPATFVAAAGERLAPLWSDHGLDLPTYAGCFESPYLDICPPSVQTVPLDHVAHRQPLQPLAYTGEPAGPLPALVTQGGDPLVYVTLGTLNNDATVLRAIAEGVAGDGIRVLVTVGPTGDPDLLGPQPSNVAVERYVSQSEVLPHCAAVISHAGSGTFLGALRAGLPQVCLPQAADQFRNSAGAATRGAAITLPPPESEPAAVADALGRVLGEQSFRRAATEVAAEIATMPTPDDVVAVLERVSA